MGSYPILRFWGRHGKLIAALAAIGVVFTTLIAGFFVHPLWLVPGFLLAAFVWLLLLSYAELIHVMMDMLLPDPELG